MHSGGETLLLTLALVGAQQIFLTSFFLLPGWVIDVLHSGERTHAALRFVGPLLTIPVLCLTLVPALARFQPRVTIQSLCALLLVQGIAQALWPIIPNATLACTLSSLNWVPYIFCELTTFRLIQQMEGDKFRGDFHPLRVIVNRVSPALRWLLVWQLSSPSLFGLLDLDDARRIAILGILGVAATAAVWLCWNAFRKR